MGFNTNLLRFLGLWVLFLVILSCAPGGKGVKKIDQNEIKLPVPKLKGTMSVEEAIQLRRSQRDYQDKPLSLEQVSQLLWSAQGITLPSQGFRAAPSAGATYPLEVYVVKDDGVFHYRPQGHTMVKTKDGDLRVELAMAALGQSWVRDAPVDIVIAAIYERTTRGYGEERGVRYVHIEVGHVAENIHLQAVALGLGSVPIGAFQDAEVARVVGLPANQAPLYIIPVGYVK